MYTYRQFKQKHSVKYAGLADAEIRKRYNDYLSNNGVVDGKQLPTRSTPQLNKRLQIKAEQQLTSKMSWKALISPCTSWYIKALVNPFGTFDEMPCIPDIISLPSYKLMCRTRGSFQIGLLGSGFVAVKPFTPVNDQPTVEFSTSTYGTANYTPFPAVGVLTAVNNSPYTTAALGINEFRLVGCGIRCHYQGSEFNRSGLVVLHRQPGNGAIAAGSNSANLLQYSTSTQAAAKRSSESVSYRPDSQIQLGYNLPIFPQASTMMIYVEGGTPATVWNYECIQFFEVVGNLQNVTASHADPVGMGAALGSLPAHNSTASPAKQEMMALQGTAHNITKASSQIVQFLGAVGKTVGSAFAGNLPGMIQGISDAPRMGGMNEAYMIANGNTGPRIDEID